MYKAIANVMLNKLHLSIIIHNIESSIMNSCFYSVGNISVIQ